MLLGHWRGDGILLSIFQPRAGLQFEIRQADRANNWQWYPVGSFTEITPQLWRIQTAAGEGLWQYEWMNGDQFRLTVNSQPMIFTRYREQ
ncbi:MAG TPA: hypothetical protein PLY87_11990 [Planctomycetaceae bacterium]|nr:hypothetical protein [Planctomycetaceae bacterium]HQZ65795.1 hypothetical protein [Planctomycetaceae bacterium]